MFPLESIFLFYFCSQRDVQIWLEAVFPLLTAVRKGNTFLELQKLRQESKRSKGHCRPIQHLALGFGSFSLRRLAPCWVTLLSVHESLHQKVVLTLWGLKSSHLGLARLDIIASSIKFKEVASNSVVQVNNSLMQLKKIKIIAKTFMMNKMSKF